MDDTGNFIVAVAFSRQQNDPGEGVHVVFHGAERMDNAPGYFFIFQALEEKLHGFDPVILPRPHVLLLPAGGKADTTLADGIGIADNRSQAAIEQPVGKVLIAQQRSLLFCLGSHAQYPGLAQRLCAVSVADLLVIFARIECQKNGYLLALVNWFTGRFVFSDGQHFDLSDSMIACRGIPMEIIDIFSVLEYSFGDKWGAISTIFDSAAKHRVERFGFEPFFFKLLFALTVFNHYLAFRLKKKRLCFYFISACVPNDTIGASGP